MTISRIDFEQEIVAMAGELRDVAIDVGSFLVLSTEATNEQRLALAKLVHRYRPQVKSVYCTIGTAGLPGDYVLFELIDERGRRNGGVFLVGGIDPEGSVST